MTYWIIHNPFSHFSGDFFAHFGLNIAIRHWYSYQIPLTMLAMCSTSLKPLERGITRFYDAYFKSNDTSHICVAAILNYPIWPPEGKFRLSAGGFWKALVITITGRNLIKLYKSERSMLYDRLSTPTNRRGALLFIEVIHQISRFVLLPSFFLNMVHVFVFQCASV